MRPLRTGLESQVPTANLRRAALTPKRPLNELAGLSDIFPYYAGFSYEWACEEIARLGLPTGAVVLDPWNGGGTTTAAARTVGVASIGVDLNPVACVVANLKACGLGARVPMVRSSAIKTRSVSKADPLLSWLSLESASRLRSWQRYAARAGGLTALTVNLALFRTIRQLTREFEGSNPTWVRAASSESERVGPDKSTIDHFVENEQEYVAGRLLSSSPSTTPCVVIQGNATRLPIAESSIDAILSSPPYLTRIDYAIAYCRELAILGITVGRNRVRESRSLRASLMGTTLIRPVAVEQQLRSVTATELVHLVEQHPSKASAGYYLKQIRQYLTDLTLKIQELSRVSRPGASMCLVVQNSYYKEIQIPLARIYIEEVEAHGWILERPPVEHDVKRYLTQLNSGAQQYTKGSVSESVLTFRRA